MYIVHFKFSLGSHAISEENVRLIQPGQNEIFHFKVPLSGTLLKEAINISYSVHAQGNTVDQLISHRYTPQLSKWEDLLLFIRRENIPLLS